LKNILLFFFLANQLFAQTGNLGLPPITNFPKTTYRAGTQNWDIAQAENGRVFFANNEGLLVFDGANWQLFPIGNRTCVRSVAIARDGKIYVGGQGEIGYFEPDLHGKLHYFSLNSKIAAENLPFTDVWDIVISSENAVYFRCAERIFEFKNEKINGFSSGSHLSFLGKLADGKMLAQDEKNGLLHVCRDNQNRCNHDRCFVAWRRQYDHYDAQKRHFFVEKWPNFGLDDAN
jgi:hypothetical protein